MDLLVHGHLHCWDEVIPRAGSLITILSQESASNLNLPLGHPIGAWMIRCGKTLIYMQQLGNVPQHRIRELRTVVVLQHAGGTKVHKDGQENFGDCCSTLIWHTS
jgi:hypothetical protein